MSHLKRIWAATWQNQQNECAPSEDSDQPGHSPSLIWDFAVRMKKPWALSYSLSAQRRLWSDWTDAQADLSLRWAHSHFVGFVMSRLIYCSCSQLSFSLCQRFIIVVVCLVRFLYLSSRIVLLFGESLIAIQKSKKALSSLAMYAKLTNYMQNCILNVITLHALVSQVVYWIWLYQYLTSGLLRGL